MSNVWGQAPSGGEGELRTAISVRDRALGEAVWDEEEGRQLAAEGSVRRTWSHPADWPWLPIILVVQIGLSLRLIWANTAFIDESLYIRTGLLDWSHWLHGTPVPDFAAYFSGSPVIYPPLAAIAYDAGGLAGARALSLVFMLATTGILYATTKSLFGRTAGIGASAIFAMLGPSEFLSAFATYDAMAIFFMAAATWCAVRARGSTSEVFLIATGLLLAIGDATKYASGLWTPVVLLVIGFTAPQPGVLRPALRVLRTAAYTVPPIVLELFVLTPRSYLQGLMFTTLDRQAGGVYASVSTVFSDSFAWVGLLFLLAVIGTVTSFFTTPVRVRWLCVLCTGAVVLAPIHEAQLHTTISLHKHVVFGAFFGAIVVGFLCERAAAQVANNRGWLIGVVVASLTLFIGLPQSTTMYVDGWPNTSGTVPELAKLVPEHQCPCLIWQENPVLLSLPKFPSEVVGPFYFDYYDQAKHHLLLGTAAYEAAIRAHYFKVVELDPSESLSLYLSVLPILAGHSGYERVYRVGQQRWTMQIWVYRGTAS